MEDRFHPLLFLSILILIIFIYIIYIFNFWRGSCASSFLFDFLYYLLYNYIIKWESIIINIYYIIPLNYIIFFYKNKIIFIYAGVRYKIVKLSPPYYIFFALVCEWAKRTNRVLIHTVGMNCLVHILGKNSAYNKSKQLNENSIWWPRPTLRSNCGHIGIFGNRVSGKMWANKCSGFRFKNLVM